MITDFSQCDEALINKLKGLIIEGEEVPVLYISPEKEFVISKYPSIVIYRSGVYPDNYRWTNDKFYDNITYIVDGIPISIDEREAPIPYNLYYGIRIYYKYQEDGARLSTYINSVLKRGAFVEIGGDYYDIVFVSYRNPNATYKEFGEQKEKEDREFVEQYLYKLEIELDIAPRVTKPVSQQVIFRVVPSKVPTHYERTLEDYFNSTRRCDEVEKQLLSTLYEDIASSGSDLISYSKIVLTKEPTLLNSEALLSSTLYTNSYTPVNLDFKY